MNMLANLQTSKEVVEDGDVLGGGFQALETGLYEFTIQVIYIEPSRGGAAGLHLHLLDDKGGVVRQTLWMTSGTAKGGKNTYTDKRTGEEKYLPGFIQANHLALLTTGEEIGVQAGKTEEKVIQLWNAEARAEVPTKVQMLEEMRGKKIIAGIQKNLVNRTVEVDGVYRPTADTREENEIVKFFHADSRKTVAEVEHGGDKPAEFIDAWEKKNAGVTRDRTEKDKSKLVAGTQGAPATTATAAKEPAKSLFG